MKLLIANRGEIAVRIIRACIEMGIGTVAVYSEADRVAPHVMMADEAHPIGPSPANESYLNMDKILEVAAISGATMVHPGYGFLAENAEFAERVEAAGITWVGPGPEAIRVLGSKTASRRLAAEVGVALIPGMMDPLENLKELEEFVEEYGFPVLLKAVAGGGGKGMRAVERHEDLQGAFERARSEGKAYFGNDQVYVERLAVRPRHIEIQIAADTHGNAVYIGERECSIQRRHQKVVEECPSPVVSPELRAEMGEAALKIVRASSYSSVGTVEFLLDQEERFYFLEMNTRLQVEHPVTEEVYGIDLVQEMIKIALGEPLSFAQDELVPRGHAIECRIYAEDPLRGFAPSPGTITLLTRPYGPGVRVDSGVLNGSVVPLDYDPMLAKLVVWAGNREKAVNRLQRALDEYQVRGVATTLPLFRALTGMDSFRNADFHTSFLDELLNGERPNKLGETVDDLTENVAVIAAACLASLNAGDGDFDPFEHGKNGDWFAGGLRVHHGRFPR